MGNDWKDDWNDEWSIGVESTEEIDYGMPESGKKGQRKKSRTLATVFTMLICLVVLTLITYLLMMFYMEGRDSKGQDFGKKDVQDAVALEEGAVTYTQQELDAKVAEAVAAAEAANQEAAAQEILSGLKERLTGGQTYVEALRPCYPDDMVVVSNGRFHFVPIQESLKKNDFTEENLVISETGEHQYVENGQVISYKGIDVSKHQGKIDWQQVAEDGVEFAFIRVALRGYGTGKLVEDEYFEQNIEGALSAGIKVGVYVFSQAITEEEVLEEANFVLEKIAPYKVECPVVFDVEKVSATDGRMNLLSVEERTNLTLLFCQTIENAGYKPMIYHNMEMGALMLDLETLENYDKWFAYYNDDFYYPYEYKIWQYSSIGRVKGITGDVDLNISFEPVWEE